MEHDHHKKKPERKEKLTQRSISFMRQIANGVNHSVKLNNNYKQKKLSYGIVS